VERSSSLRRHVQHEHGEGNLLEGSCWMERLRGGLAVVGSRTWRRQSTHIALGADTVEPVVKTSAGKHGRSMTTFYRGGDAVVRRGDGRPGSGGALSRGGQLWERRRGD
jgi:hypothetical protein